jgi:AcrR family transcriptional regulator
MKHTKKRQHLLNVASDLFNRLGYRGAGIDQLIEVAGVAKTTLYRYFKSKEELIVAVLRLIDEQYRSDMRQAVDKQAGSAKQKLLATFDFLEVWFKDNEFYGCPFMGAAAEYNERSHPVFQQTVLHKRLMVAYFEELARAAQLNDPVRIAEEVNLLHEGAIAVAHVTGDIRTARKAKFLANSVIESASTQRSSVVAATS